MCLPRNKVLGSSGAGLIPEVNIMRILHLIALTLVIIGALNWGLVGLFNFDLVAFLFGEMSWLSRIVYALVGVAGIWAVALYRAIEPARTPHRVTTV